MKKKPVRRDWLLDRMKVMHLVGKDPRFMTYVAFNGILFRATRLRGWMAGHGPTEIERLMGLG